MADRRTAVVRARVLPSEHAVGHAKAAAAGVSPSDLLRQAMARTRTRTARAVAVERGPTRQVARIGNKLSQIARSANTHAEAVEVIAHLVAIERAIALKKDAAAGADGMTPSMLLLTIGQWRYPWASCCTPAACSCIVGHIVREPPGNPAPRCSLPRRPT